MVRPAGGWSSCYLRAPGCRMLCHLWLRAPKGTQGVTTSASRRGGPATRREMGLVHGTAPAGGRLLLIPSGQGRTSSQSQGWLQERAGDTVELQTKGTAWILVSREQALAHVPVHITSSDPLQRKQRKWVHRVEGGRGHREALPHSVPEVDDLHRGSQGWSLKLVPLGALDEPPRPHLQGKVRGPGFPFCFSYTHALRDLNTSQ